MSFDMAMTGFVALYIFMLAAFAGWVIIGNVPAILHTPLMSGSNFVHGIVVVGGLYALFNAVTPLEQAIGFFADHAGTFIPDNLKDHVSVGLGGFSASGILAVLMIFVLAQIFRHGSAMRAELEGMV